MGGWNPYPLLGKLASTLVLGVAKELDNAALVGSESAEMRVSMLYVRGGVSGRITQRPP